MTSPDMAPNAMRRPISVCARQERTRRAIGRPSNSEAYRAQVERWLKEEPDLPSLELFRRAKLAGYDGAESALYELVRGVRRASDLRRRAAER